MSVPKKTYIVKYDEVDMKTAYKLTRMLCLFNTKRERFILATTKDVEGKLTCEEVVKFLKDVEAAENIGRALTLPFDVEAYFAGNFIPMLELFGVFMEME